ncbi:hypothetical protein CCICO_01320 [Corynebacterium ciconiae DSM 44920]|uniref:hypothetical protein n=1 Tax=Corynebacterium ciconiae TaxID=227319 RepID=UPI0003624B0C|nr:hypothetical protein [Corynebacterium ciconiae]WKD60318.1 hypothetical protein CCICO_01320 [Corynebacterium ciconiae DSM 44920]
MPYIIIAAYLGIAGILVSTKAELGYWLPVAGGFIVSMWMAIETEKIDRKLGRP